MKATILIAIFVALATACFAQTPTYISVHFAVQDTEWGNGRTHLGFSWSTGAVSDKTTIQRNSKEICSNSYPQASRIDHVDNLDWGSYKGDYLIVISADVPNGYNTSQYFGIGFGADITSALADAKKNLGINCWSWSERKHGFNTVKSTRM
ncbi:hypothetical protein IEN85_09885 [Pelagicoccus sp. NFK12]|uniref:Uncharacterized protein n=1 Tax=Pelagicoccus enzymogenes TaxID=2773457 RepID=A0A927IF68_9BACT|nr:hypothetical protein [Pelagicoccus enzymogenes]MBD5779802.1 hypothetical protein [Pelagicoccus enzymogenes]